jgi:ABC-type Fe3+ transport system permease subunit
MLNSQLDDESSLHYAVSEAEASGATEQRNYNNNSREQQQKRRQSATLIARKETNQVWCLRIALLTVLLIVAISFAVLVHTYTSKNERNGYRDTVREFANLIQATVQTTAQNRLESVGS